ncbi:MAG: DUF4384 domain-containing protein [Gemmatimonadota bacterium]|nr:DUF4384 domain-containing protein [Gemmatimonadota bacterium]
MKRTLQAIALMTAVAACSYNKPNVGVSPSSGGRLRARLSPVANEGWSRVRFDVSRPAYVAVFEIAPGRGVSLLFPMSHEDAESPFVGGASYLLYDTPGRWYYQSDFAPSGDVPSYRLLIASDRPLGIARYLTSPGQLRADLGFQTFASTDPYRTMDQLLELVLPGEPEDSWTTDLDVIWRSNRYRNADSDLLLVRCFNGHELFVPYDYPYRGCPGDGRSWVYNTGNSGYVPGIPNTGPKAPLRPKQPSDTTGSGGKPVTPENPVTRRRIPTEAPGVPLIMPPSEAPTRRLLPADVPDRNPRGKPASADGPSIGGSGNGYRARTFESPDHVEAPGAGSETRRAEPRSEPPRIEPRVIPPPPPTLPPPPPPPPAPPSSKLDPASPGKPTA